MKTVDRLGAEATRSKKKSLLHRDCIFKVFSENFSSVVACLLWALLHGQAHVSIYYAFHHLEKPHCLHL